MAVPGMRWQESVRAPNKKSIFGGSDASDRYES
jgi:hypothetical protein